MTTGTFQTLNYAWMTLAIVVFVILLKITAPYGRHSSRNWGPQISNRFGWILMEMPGMALVLYFILAHLQDINRIGLLLAGFYLLHYINRTLIFPFRIHTQGKKMPLVIALMAVCFNLMNGFLLGYYFSFFAQYSDNYLFSFNFIAGAALFITGMYINQSYDTRLINLRKASDTGYVIPKGGLFNLISCPNLFGEIIEWTGFAVLCWNLPALSFLVWTLANLIPRAISHHKWYKQKFEDYPEARKAVFPYVV